MKTLGWFGSLIAALVLLAQRAPGAEYTWTQTAAGTYAWPDAANWGGSGFPNGVDDVGNLAINISGAQTINLSQAITLGTLNLGDTGSSYLTTAIAPNGGSLILDVSSGSATISKATAGNTATDTISAAIQLNDDLIVTNAATNSGGGVTLSGVISESGGAKTLTKAGAGILTLSGNNSYSGGTILDAGTLTLSSGAALGAGSLTINGGSLNLTTSLTGNNSITANESFTFTASSNNTNTGTGDLRIAKAISITGGADNNPWQGLVVSNSITDASGGNTLNALDITWNQTSSTRGITLSAPITMRGTQTLTVSNNQSMTGFNVTGAIGEAAAGYGLTFAGTSINPIGANLGRGGGIALMAANTYTGTTTINSGVTVMLGLGSTTGSLSTSSAIVNNGYLVFNRSNTLTQGTDFSSNISGLGQLVQNGGTTVLNAANNHAGGTTIQGGTLRITGNSVLGMAGTALTLRGGTLQFAAESTVDVTRPVVMAGNATVDTSLASGTISGVISSTANLTKTGSNNLTLSGVNAFTGDTTISGGRVLLGNARALQNSTYVTTGSNGTIGLDFNGVTSPVLGGLSGAVALATATTGFGSVTTLTLNPQSGKSPSYSGVIGDGAGGLALVKTGVGTQTLTGANTFTGGVTIRGGTLVADTANNATVLQTAGLTFDGTGTFQLKGLASNPRSQAFSGLTLTTGEATIDANNLGTFTTIDLGGITRTAGTVDFRATTGTFGTTALVTSTRANDATGILGTWATVGGGNWAANNGLNDIVAYTGYSDIALGDTIADASSSNVRINSGSSGNITLGATTTNINTLLQNNASAASVTMTGGTLRFGTGGGVMVGTGRQALTIGTAANQGVVTAGGNAVDVAGELVFNTSSNQGLTVNSTITNNGTGAVSVVKSGTGSGSLTLAGTNTFSGGFTLNSGTVNPTNAAAFGAGTLTINGGGISVSALTLSGNIPIVMNGDWSAKTQHSGAVLNLGTGGITLNRPITINVTNSVLTLGGAISSPGSAFNALDIALTRSDTQSATVNFTAGVVLRGNQVANPNSTVPTITYSGTISDGGNGYGMTFSSPSNFSLGTTNFTGPIVIDSGSTVSVRPGGSLTPSSITINRGGRLTLGEQNLGSSAGTVSTGTTIVNNGTLRIGDNTAYVQGTQFPSGISGVGVVEITGTRVNAVTLNGTNTYSGGTSVVYTGGGGPLVLNINSANAIGTGPLTLSQSGNNFATINNTSGGAITLATNNPQNWNGPFIFTGTQSLNLGTGSVTLANNPTAQVSANTLTVGGTVSGSTQTLAKTGSGTLALNGATTLGSLNIGNQTGATGGGTLSVGSGGSLSLGTGTSSVLRVGEGSGTAFGRGEFDLSAANSFTANVGTFSVGYSTRGNGDNQSGGVLNLSAANTITATTVIIGETTAVNGAGGTRWVTTAANGTTTINTGGMNIAIGGVNTSTFTLGSNASLTLRGAGGAGTRTGLTIGSSNVAWGSSGGSMDLSAGQASLLLSQLVVGKTTNTGNVAGSSLTLGASGSNHLNVNAATGNAVQIGYSTSANSATGTLTIGNLNASSEIATADPAATAILVGYQSGAGTATGTLNLNGGALTITTTGTGIGAGGSGGTSTLNLNGMTLRPGASTGTFISGLTNARMYGGGLTVDTDGKSITIPQSLVAAPATSTATSYGLEAMTVITPTAGGSGYTSPPSVSFNTPTGGTPATGIAQINTAGQVTGIVITNPGSGYSNGAAATISLSGGGGTGATFTNPTATIFQGGGGLTKTGLGSLALSGTNTYAGPTMVTGGTLAVVDAGSINSSGLTLDGGHLRYDSSVAYSGAFTFTRGSIGGTNLTGNLGGLIIGTDRTLSPGMSPGIAATTSQIWDAGGTYLWEINDPLGTAGDTSAGWDLLTGTGSLTILADSTDRFTVAIRSLNPANAPGFLFGFDPAQDYAWKIADFANPISTFSADAFTVNTSSFVDSFNGSFSVALGTSVTDGTANQLYMVYTVPEPGTIGLIAAAVGFALALRRRR